MVRFPPVGGQAYDRKNSVYDLFVDMAFRAGRLDFRLLERIRLYKP